MLYIEDFLELIEPFPQEIRERLTEMREIDLHIQNETDKLDERIETFFQHCKKQKSEWKTDNFEAIKKEYVKLLENADEKVVIANQLYDLIEKYLKKLDQELHKFKLELEADHAGITSKLEQVISKKNPNDTSISNGVMGALTSTSSTNCLNFNAEDSDFTLCSSSTNDLILMMLNNNATSSTATNAGASASAASTMLTSSSTINDHLSLNNLNSSLAQTQQNATLGSHKRKHSSILNEKSYLNTNNISFNGNNHLLINNIKDDEDSSSSWNSRLDQTTSNLNVNNNINNLINNSNATSSTNAVFHTTHRKNNSININSRANVLNRRSSQQLRTKKSRPTAVGAEKNQLSSSSSLIKKSRLISDIDAYDDEAFVDDENARNEFYQSDDNNNNEETTADDELNEEVESAHGPGDDLENEQTTTDDETSNEFDSTNKLKHQHRQYAANNNRLNLKEEWNSSEDTNERYCICKDVSYGDMIMCDNRGCGTQWFHFVCVGLSSAPKGKWFCPSCADIRKKRREKQLSSLINATSSNHTFSSTSIGPATSSSLLQPNSNDVILNHNMTHQFVTSSSSSSSSTSSALTSNDKKIF